MLLSKKHPFTGVVNSLELDTTPEELLSWQQGAMAQQAFPRLSPDEREFVISGLLSGEFDKLFEEEEEGATMALKKTKQWLSSIE